MTHQGLSHDVDVLRITLGNKNVLRRWLGAWIDFVTLFSMLLIPNLLLGDSRYQSTVVVWASLTVLYFPVTEGLTGRSLGKLLTGTVVVTADGRVPGLGRAVVRTLLRVVEVNPLFFGGIPAGIAVLASSHGQRLGDMAARTYVVLARDLT